MDKDYLFLLFNDIVLQCKVMGSSAAAAGSGGPTTSPPSSSSSPYSSSSSSSYAYSYYPSSSSLSSSLSFSSPYATQQSHWMMSPDVTYELQRTLRLQSRKEPAKIFNQTWIHSGAPDFPRATPKELLRIVDDEVILYLRGSHEELTALEKAINSR